MATTTTSLDQRSASASNPYLFAQRKWDERYGSLVNGARYWRMAAMLAIAAVLVLSAVVIVIGTRPRLVPFLVTQDNVGHVTSLGPVNAGVPIDDQIKRREIGRWIEDVRSVTTDAYAEKRAIVDRVYPKLSSNSPARVILDQYFRSEEHDPFKLGQKETVQVDINSVLETSPHTYEIDWTETARSLNGDPISSEKWKAVLTLAFNPPQDELLMWKNPLGIYVMNLAWSKVL